MNVSTSWKKTRGFVSELIGLVDEAMRDGNTPPYEVYRWCVFETTQQCPRLRCVPVRDDGQGRVGRRDDADV
jgi:hypothetical protein